MLRISRGPWRAPGRLVVPPSQGTPIRATSSFFGSRSIGSRINVATSPKRGTAMPDIGCGNLSGIEHLLPACFLQLPDPLAQPRILSMHTPKLLEHPALRIIEALHDRGKHMHVVAQ